MANVYTTRLAEIVKPTSGDLFFPVPTGFVWDVRDVEVQPDNGFPGQYMAGPVNVKRDTGATICSFGPLDLISNVHVQWQGRALLREGELLLVEVGGPFFDVFVTGYQLSLP